jgi:PhnB protein
MQVEAYLQFDGRCEEALDFYKKAIGAEVEQMMRFSETPDPCPEGMLPPGAENKVMHSCFRIGSTRVMASDGYCKGAPKFEGFSLALQTKTKSEAERLFNALADGGTVEMPLGETFFSPSFGMVADKFGVHWMVVTMTEAEAAKSA